MPNLVSRLGFCLLAGAVAALDAVAQPVPGRDLLEFPVGMIAEAPTLATMSRDGVWNPASILLDPGHRMRLVAAALDAASEQGVTAQLVAFALAFGADYAAGLSVLRASVSDIPRTEGDPQTVGPDIPYGSLLVSGALARRLGPSVDLGVALRYQRGELDADVRSAASVDGGIVLHSIGIRDLRVAASTFLLRTGFADGRSADARLSAAADLRLFGGGASEQVRLGYSYAQTRSLGTDHYVFLSGRLRILELNGGIARTDAHGASTHRSRLGVALRTESFSVGLAREENVSGLAPTYQVVVSTFLRRSQ